MKEASSERGEAFIFLAPCSPLGEGSSPPLAVHQNGMRTPGELVERFPEVSPCLPLPPPLRTRSPYPGIPVFRVHPPLSPFLSNGRLPCRHSCFLQSSAPLSTPRMEIDYFRILLRPFCTARSILGASLSSAAVSSFCAVVERALGDPSPRTGMNKAVDATTICLP